MIKILLSNIVIIFSLAMHANAETYVCASKFDGETTIAIFERNGDQEFIFETHSNGKMPIDNLYETEDELVLGGLFGWGKNFAFMTKYLDKKTLIMRSQANFHPSGEPYNNNEDAQCKLTD